MASTFDRTMRIRDRLMDLHPYLRPRIQNIDWWNKLSSYVVQRIRNAWMDGYEKGFEAGYKKGLDQGYSEGSDWWRR